MKARTIPHRNERAVNDGPNGGGKAGITKKIILDGMA
jgi:hypothetical protein